MNTNPNIPSSKGPGDRPEGVAHLDAELLTLAAGLDRLGAIDRGAAGAELEDRLMQGTLGALHGVQPVSAQVAELGAMDRAAAPSDLEQGVFEASSPALQESVAAAGVLRHIGQPDREPRTHLRFGRRVWWSNAYARLAAVMVLAAGAVIAVQMGTKIKATAPETIGQGELERLFTEVGSQPATPDTTSGSEDFDPDKLADWLSEGAAS